ncbi:MAG: SRPBCC domain-containing protein [Planctomycetota bacterium]
MNEDRKFEMEIDIAAPRDAVWQALAEQEELERWFAPDAEVTPGVGGAVTWRWGDLHDWISTIEVYTPGDHLRLRYDSAVPAAGGGMRPLFVDFHLEGAGGTTTLRLVHSGFGPEASFDAEFDGISGGWPVELRSLRLYLERHRGRDRQLAWARRSTQVEPEALWRALIGDGGLQAPKLTALAEGATFRVDVAGAGAIAGRALFVPGAREFSGVAQSLGDGWFRAHCERWAGATQCWLWLALYDRPDAEVQRFCAAFERLLDRAVAAATATGEATA